MCSHSIRLQDSNHQYFWGESTNVLAFLHRDNNQGKIACKTTTTGSVWSDIPRLNRGEFSWSGVVLPH